MSLLVVGSIALDSVKTPFGEVTDALGGSCSYACMAASRFVKDVAMVGVVGDDFPERHRSLFSAHGIDVDGLETAAGKTFRWGGEYGFDLNSRTTLFTDLNVFADFEPKLSPKHRAAKNVFLANIDPVLQGKVLDQVDSPDLVVMDSMNFWIEGAKDALLQTISRVDVLLLNDEEARMLTGEVNLIKAGKGVLELGPSVVIVKKGEHGALVFSKEFQFSAPAYPVEFLFDPTGAGDSFAGGFLGYLAATEDQDPGAIRRAIIYGTVTASFCVESFSLDKLANISRQDLEKRFEEVREFSRF